MKKSIIKRYLLSLLALSLLCLQSIQANANGTGVAKIVIVKGIATDLKTNSKLKKDDWVSEGAIIKTEDKAFAKLIFIDKSTMNVGPNSQIEIQEFKKDKAGIVNLVEGQIRSQVTKNYMEMDKKDSKLFIKTRTAAMGVRGTDFQVNFNPENMNTSLITFEGAVAMGAINDLKAKGFNQKSLEQIVSDSSAVMVRRGEFSGVMPNIDTKPVAPVRINTKQLKAMEKNDGSLSQVDETSKKDSNKLESRGTIPPGVSGEEFQGVGKKELMKEIAKVDLQTAQTISLTDTPIKKDSVKVQSTNMAFRDGGYVNTQVVAYIAPPKNAAVDPMTKQPIIPVTLGRIDPATGAYKNDYYQLNNDLSWKPISPTDSRTPASSNTAASPTGIKPPAITGDCLNCANVPINPDKLPTTGTIDTTKIVEQSQDKVDAISDQIKSSGKTKINIEIK